MLERHCPNNSAVLAAKGMSGLKAIPHELAVLLVKELLGLLSVKEMGSSWFQISLDGIPYKFLKAALIVACIHKPSYF